MKYYLLILTIFLVLPLAHADVPIQCTDRYVINEYTKNPGDNTYLYTTQGQQTTFYIEIKNNGNSPFQPVASFQTFAPSSQYPMELMRDYWVKITQSDLLFPNATTYVNITIFYNEKLKPNTNYFGEINISCGSFSKIQKMFLQEQAGIIPNLNHTITIQGYEIPKYIILIAAIIVGIIWISMKNDPYLGTDRLLVLIIALALFYVSLT